MWPRVALLGLLICAGVWSAMTVGVPDVAAMRTRLNTSGPVGWLVILGVLALALSVPTPRSALSALAGATAGFSAGLGLVLVGGLLGALFGFGVSRWLGRTAVARLVGSRWPRVDRFLTDRAFGTVLVARLLPAPPFAVVSYAAGVSGVRLAPYLLGTAVGILPGSVVYVSLGASASGLDTWTRDLGAWAWTLIGLAVAAAGSVAWWGRRQLSRRPRWRRAVAGRPGGRRPSAARAGGQEAVRARPDDSLRRPVSCSRPRATRRGQRATEQG